MDIYYAITPYHTLCCLLHKININTKTKSLLYLSNINFYAPNLAEKINKSKIFDEVILFDDSYCLRGSIGSNICDSIDSINHKVNELVSNNIFDANQLFICGDHFPIGIYCMSKGVGYNFFEDGSGIYTRSNLLFDSVKSSNVNHYDIMVQLKANGKNDSVKTKYINMNAQLKESNSNYMSDSNIIDFNVGDILSKLDEKIVSQLLDIYNTSVVNIENDNKNALILTQHFANQNIMSLSEQEHLYALVADYYVGNEHNLFVKLHPSDVHGRYEQKLRGAVLLDGYFPSELLPYFIRDNYEIGISISSTAIFNLNNCVNSKIMFSKKTESEYINMHRYFAVSKIFEKLNLDTASKVYSIQIDDSQLINFIKINKGIANLNVEAIHSLNQINYQNEENVFVIDRINIQNNEQDVCISNFLMKLRDNDVVIFINSDETNSFYECGYEEVFKHVAHFQIEKIYQKNDFDENIENENIFVFCKNKSKLNLIKSVEAIRELTYSEMIIRLYSGSPEQTKIERLVSRGILKSTIERLKLYAGHQFNFQINVDRISDDCVYTILQTMERRLLSFINNEQISEEVEV